LLFGEGFSPFFPVRLFFGFAIAFHRIAARINEIPALFHDSVSALTQRSRLFIQTITAVSSKRSEPFATLLASEYRGRCPAYGSQS
jgi:hypothetical protein